MRVNQRYGDRIIVIEGENLETKSTIEIGLGHMRDKIRTEVLVRSRSGLRATTNRDRIRCFECREYDHFMIDCSTTQGNGEVEQIQQMINMDTDQPILQILLMDIDQVRQTISPVETRDNLKS